MKLTRSQFLLLLIFVFASIGLVDSILIHLKEIESLSNVDVFRGCQVAVVFDCASVASSKYAHFYGLPVSLIGILYYEAVAGLALFLGLGLKFSRWQYVVTSTIVVGSLLFSLRLLFYSYFGLGVLCPYCLVSNASTLLVSLTWAVYIRQLKAPSKG